MAIARKVLTSETASAPASSDARANDATSVTFGVSFGNHWQRRHLLHRADRRRTCREAAAERDAAFLDVRARDVQLERATPSGSDRMRASSTYSSRVLPQMLTMTVARSCRSSGSFLANEAVDADAPADRWRSACLKGSRRSARVDGLLVPSGRGPLTATAPSVERSTGLPRTRRRSRSSRSQR
jgi:hypothetical protein